MSKRAEMRRAKKAEDKEQNRAPQTAYEKAFEKGFISGYHEGIKYGSAETVRLCTTSFVATIKNELGFGAKRLRNILELFGATIAQCQEDNAHEEKMRKYFLEKIGIDLDEFTGCSTLDRAREYNARSMSSEEIRQDFKDVLAENPIDGIVGTAINMHGYNAKIRE